MPDCFPFRVVVSNRPMSEADPDVSGRIGRRVPTTACSPRRAPATTTGGAVGGPHQDDQGGEKPESRLTPTATALMAAACENRTPTRNVMAQRGFLGARRHRMSSATGVAMATTMHTKKNRNEVKGSNGRPSHAAQAAR